MCGIFGLFSASISSDTIQAILKSLSPRGPDHQAYQCGNFNSDDSNPNQQFMVGFTRLSINGIQNGNQPFVMGLDGILNHRGPLYLVCNGEIYNYKELYQEYGIQNHTDSDCEIILHLYRLYGIERTLELIDGVFSFILLDLHRNQFNVARDPFGVRPLFMYTTRHTIGFSSELKGFMPIINQMDIDRDVNTECKREISEYTIRQFPPSFCHVYQFDSSNTNSNSNWMFYESFRHYRVPTGFKTISYQDAYTRIVSTLYNAVKKRVLTTERPIACLLSGGLDSSLITAMVSHCLKQYNSHYRNGTKKLQTFSIGMKGGEDLVFARDVASHLGTRHYEIVLTEREFIDTIPLVIQSIESYDTTTVRASVGNYLIGNYIRDNTDCKVVFNGDGSDEVCGGYLYFHHAPNAEEFDKECKRLLNDIHYFDVLRSDRSIASHGLEARTPFLDKQFVSSYLEIDSVIRYQPDQCEKFMLRKAFDTKWSNLLPDHILWRTKEAFSDGVSKTTRSWHTIIQHHTNKLLLNPKKQWIHNPPTTNEQRWYRTIWESYYPPQCSTIIPYFWMPRFIESDDASARSLSVYSNSK